MKGIWLIGDVHGEFDKLIKLIDKLPKKSEIVFTGDLVDRGKKSAEVIDLVITNNYNCVLGNHELMMIKSMVNEENNFMWQCSGGEATLKSYNNYSDDIWISHIDFLKSLPYYLYFEFDGYRPLVVSHSYIHHVWVDENFKYDENSGEDILWRHMYLKELFKRDKEIKNNIFNVFGHSPVNKPIITDTYAMIDTGAVYEQLGFLSAIYYPSLESVSVF